jgi:hypothetical protein
VIKGTQKVMMLRMGFTLAPGPADPTKIPRYAAPGYGGAGWGEGVVEDPLLALRRSFAEAVIAGLGSDPTRRLTAAEMIALIPAPLVAQCRRHVPAAQTPGGDRDFLMVMGALSHGAGSSSAPLFSIHPLCVEWLALRLPVPAFDPSVALGRATRVPDAAKGGNDVMARARSLIEMHAAGTLRAGDVVRFVRRFAEEPLAAATLHWVTVRTAPVVKINATPMFTEALERMVSAGCTAARIADIALALEVAHTCSVKVSTMTEVGVGIDL